MNRDEEGFSVVPKWNEEASSLVFRSKSQAVLVKKEVRYLCGPRALAQMDPEKQYKLIRAAITNVQLTGEGGAHLIVSALRAALETKHNPRSSATLPTTDWPRGHAPRKGRDHAKVDFSL